VTPFDGRRAPPVGLGLRSAARTPGGVLGISAGSHRGVREAPYGGVHVQSASVGGGPVAASAGGRPAHPVGLGGGLVAAFSGGGLAHHAGLGWGSVAAWSGDELAHVSGIGGSLAAAPSGGRFTHAGISQGLAMPPYDGAPVSRASPSVPFGLQRIAPRPCDGTLLVIWYFLVSMFSYPLLDASTFFRMRHVLCSDMQFSVLFF